VTPYRTVYTCPEGLARDCAIADGDAVWLPFFDDPVTNTRRSPAAKAIVLTPRARRKTRP